MLPWTLLDFAVIAPAASTELPYRFHGSGGQAHGLTEQTSIDEVAVAVGGDPQGDPDWVVTTRARRGIRPLNSATLDHLSLDIDLQGAGGDAVRHLLLMTLPEDLDRTQLMARVDRAVEESSDVGAGLRFLSGPSDVWVRELLIVDEQRHAMWVHRRPEGWAATADVGYATVTLFGTVEPAQWIFAGLTLLAARAALST